MEAGQCCLCGQEGVQTSPDLRSEPNCRSNQLASLNDRADAQVHAEELPALLSLYERNGYFDEIISLMEGGLGLERAHMVGS